MKTPQENTNITNKRMTRIPEKSLFFISAIRQFVLFVFQRYAEISVTIKLR